MSIKASRNTMYFIYVVVYHRVCSSLSRFHCFFSSRYETANIKINNERRRWNTASVAKQGKSNKVLFLLRCAWKKKHSAIVLRQTSSTFSFFSYSTLKRIEKFSHLNHISHDLSSGRALFFYCPMLFYSSDAIHSLYYTDIRTLPNGGRIHLSNRKIFYDIVYTRVKHKQKEFLFAKNHTMVNLCNL